MKNRFDYLQGRIGGYIAAVNRIGELWLLVQYDLGSCEWHRDYCAESMMEDCLCDSEKDRPGWVEE